MLDLLGWLINNAFVLFVGYAICVLFPVPGLSRWILEKWAAGWSWIKSNIL